MIKDLEQHQKDWYDQNQPLGKDLGYPDCCINEFCKQPPIWFEHTKASEHDKLRYKAGCINGKFTGFIPCTIHAKKIMSGEITLESLIVNRKGSFPPFPYFAYNG